MLLENAANEVERVAAEGNSGLKSELLRKPVLRALESFEKRKEKL